MEKDNQSIILVLHFLSCNLALYLFIFVIWYVFQKFYFLVSTTECGYIFPVLNSNATKSELHVAFDESLFCSVEIDSKYSQIRF